MNTTVASSRLFLEHTRGEPHPGTFTLAGPAAKNALSPDIRMACSFSSFRKLRTSWPPHLKFHPHLQPRPHQHFLSPPPCSVFLLSIYQDPTCHRFDFFIMLFFSLVKAWILNEGREFCLCVHCCLPSAPRTMSGTCKLSTCVC